VTVDTETPPCVDGYGCLRRAWAKVAEAGRDSRNTQQGWAYRSIDGLINAARPALVDTGMILVGRQKSVVIADGRLTLDVDYDLTCPHGNISLPITSMVDSRTGLAQAVGSAWSYADKLALQRLLLIPYPDEDPDRDATPDKPANRSTPARAPRTRRTTPGPSTSAVRPEPAEQPSPARPDLPDRPGGISELQRSLLGKLMRQHGITDRAAALDYVANVIHRPIDSRNDLTRAEASRVIERLTEPPPAEPPDEVPIDQELLDVQETLT
jgi:ERF superfamily protein